MVPVMKPLRHGATRAEVLAAVAEQDALLASLPRYADDDIDWRGDPPDRREGCYWSKDGRVRVNVGHPREENAVLARQRLAGEEDQSQPGWDQGA